MTDQIQHPEEVEARTDLPDVPPVTKAVDPERLSLLVVDDEPDVLDALRRLFRKSYTLHLALNASEALAIMEAHEIHLVLSDQRMPEMTGVELLSLVRDRYPRAVRMLVTGYGGDINAVVEAINKGHVYRYIHKPFDPAELKITLAQAADLYQIQAERERLMNELAERNAQLDRQNRDLAEAYDRLRTTNRLRGVTIEVLGHELNTPAAVILGYTSLLRRGTINSGTPLFTTALDGIEGGGRRLKGIADKLTKVMLGDVAGLRLNYEIVSAGALIESIREELEPVLAVRRQTLDVRLEPSEITLSADRMLLHDILLNLVINAIKFSPDGRTIWVTVGNGQWNGQPAVEFSVRDEGVGIHPDDREQIFTSLFGTFRSRHHSSGDFEFEKRGLGLGLAIVKKFAELHQGTVTFESELGQGSEFKVLIPVILPHGVANEAQAV